MSEYNGTDRRSAPRLPEQLTEAEIAELSRIIESERRMQWLCAFTPRYGFNRCI